MRGAAIFCFLSAVLSLFRSVLLVIVCAKQIHRFAKLVEVYERSYKNERAQKNHPQKVPVPKS